MPPRGWARGVIVLALALFGFAAPVRAVVCQPDLRPEEMQVLLVAAGLSQARGVAMVGQREPRPCSFVAVSRLAARADPRMESAMLVEQ